MSKVRYQALGPLLSGEGSRAFLGLEISDEGQATPVVLVWVPEEANRDAELFERIRHETEHAASLDHPNIIKVFGFATLDEGTARVVEFADGESLRRILEVSQRMPVRFAARVCADAAIGVHYAHLAGNDDGSPLCHGDLRPETMIVSFAGVTKVAGYGALNVAPREMGGQRVKGRRLHCAPEQVLGGRDAIDRQTDVYLLGLTLYELVVGVVPFEFELDFDQAVLTKPLPSIETADVPAAVKEVITRATAKKAGDRYATALELKEALEAAVGGLPSIADFSRFLGEYFPPNEEKRSARRRALDEGTADFARRQWDLEKSAPRPAVQAKAKPKPAPVAVVPSTPKPKPAPVKRVQVAPDDAEDSFSSETYLPSRRPSRAMIAGIGGVALLAVVAFLAGSRSGGKPPPVEPKAAPVASPSAPPPAAEVAAAPAPPEEKVAEAPSRLELFVEPAVDLMIDGKESGRAPFNGPMTPGRHTVGLSDKGKGISTTRVVMVKSKGVTQERVFLSKGFVSISAPDGALVVIDGKQVGKAPMKEISVYEGSHKIVVMVGKAKWQQAFSVRGNERMYFNVETE